MSKVGGRWVFLFLSLLAGVGGCQAPLNYRGQSESLLAPGEEDQHAPRNEWEEGMKELYGPFLSKQPSRPAGEE